MTNLGYFFHPQMVILRKCFILVATHISADLVILSIGLFSGRAFPSAHQNFCVENL